ncbi:MAG: YHS domain-containing protein [Bryobacteraceae bacterium]
MKNLALAISLTVIGGGVAVAAPAPQAKTQPAAKAATDPVCGMKVDAKTADQSVYQGKTYYFCSKEDKAAFDKHPANYVKK